MKKGMNKGLVLFALCMQQGSGTVVAEVGSLMTTNFEVNKDDLSRRLLRLQDQLKSIPDSELRKAEDLVHEIVEIYDESDQNAFSKLATTNKKRNHLKSKLQELAQRFRYVQLSKRHAGEVSRYIDKIEKLSSRK